VRQIQRLWVPPLLPIGSCSRLTRAFANLQRYSISQHAGVVSFRPDTSGRGAAIAFVRERLPKVLEMDLTGRPTVVGPSRIRFR
jgi:hypothetical protein